MHITGIYYYPSQKIRLKDNLQVTLIPKVFNTSIMVYQDHSKLLMSHCE